MKGTTLVILSLLACSALASANLDRICLELRQEYVKNLRKEAGRKAFADLQTLGCDLAGLPAISFLKPLGDSLKDRPLCGSLTENYLNAYEYFVEKMHTTLVDPYVEAVKTFTALQLALCDSVYVVPIYDNQIFNHKNTAKQLECYDLVVVNYSRAYDQWTYKKTLGLYNEAKRWYLEAKASGCDVVHIPQLTPVPGSPEDDDQQEKPEMELPKLGRRRSSNKLE